MLRYLIPLAGFVVLVTFLGMGLKLDPSVVPSPLVGKPAPDFTLPSLQNPGKPLGTRDFKGKVWLLNVWASWCSACRVEHPVLNAWSRSGEVELIGLNYKDEVTAAQQWLTELGNPYSLNLVDADGKVGIDLGVYGVPETFVIDKKGIIRYKHIGPVGADDIKQILIPLLNQLNAEVA